MRYFIYFRNSDYAKILAGENPNSYIKNSESEILGVDAVENDVFIVDAHHGEGDMSDLNGLKVACKLLKSIGNRNAKIRILSWFTKEQMAHNNQFTRELTSSRKIEFFQLP